MIYHAIVKLSAGIGLIVGILLLATTVVAYVYNEASITTLVGFAVVYGVWGVVGLTIKTPNRPLRRSHAFLLTSLAYFLTSLLCILPFYTLAYLDDKNMSVTDAVFETVSGLTTTGATVMSDLDSTSKSLLFYRHILQWVGGIGIVLLAVAVLPMLRIGGMQLYEAESSSTLKGQAIFPRFRKTGNALAVVYVGLTALCCGCYYFAGMSFFDALCHAFSTIAIGGFSTHDLSMGFFDNAWIEVVAIVFMLIAALNFSLHIAVLTRFYRRMEKAFRDVIGALKNELASENGRLRPIWEVIKLKAASIYTFLTRRERAATFQIQQRFKDKFSSQRALSYKNDQELITFLVCVALLMGVICIATLVHFDWGEWSFLAIAFQTVSFMTTTGYATVDLQTWPLAVTFLLLISATVGGCIGSTAGGIKVSRLILLIKQGYRETKRLLHPNGVFYVKHNNQVVSTQIVESVWGFFAIYVATFFILLLIVLFISDVSLETGFSAVVACLNNLGPGIGELAHTYANISDPVKWVLTAAMILGRLELMTLLILLMPHYWFN